MTPEIAQMNMEFLKRAELKGIEVDAFLTVCAALRAIIDAASETPASGEKS